MAVRIPEQQLVAEPQSRTGGHKVLPLDHLYLGGDNRSRPGNPADRLDTTMKCRNTVPAAFRGVSKVRIPASTDRLERGLHWGLWLALGTCLRGRPALEVHQKVPYADGTEEVGEGHPEDQSLVLGQECPDSRAAQRG